ncbi:hypothetical protein Bca52824_048837 [Brassica carinata]|uniref:UBA domain-containing protein n=1 Tax=Brassica carinata TaxID=52824 RepID=A0A8X7RLM3_BRACI|nr:hypothetical protein Bca52824_048837 [Brassica carinata]
MTDRARRIGDELRVCREEAIFYLEGLDWDLDAAMEACRSKTLNLPSRDRAVLQFCDERRPTPSQRKVNRKLGRLNSQQYSQDDETSAAVGTLVELIREEQVPKAIPPMVSSHMKVQESTSLVQDGEEKLSLVKESAEGTLSSVSSSQLTNAPEEQLSQWKEESIKSFFKVDIGASRDAAIACLSHCKWNQEDAICYFFGDYTEAIQESTSPVKESAVAVPSSMSSRQLMSWPEDQLSRLKEKIIKSFRDVVIVASREDAEACLDYGEWNQEDAISYFFGDYAEANPEIARSQADGKAVDEDSRIKSLEEASGAKSHVKIQESSSPTQTREDSRKSSREQRSQWKDELIHSFLELADGVTREVATVYLTLSNWNVEEAFSFLLEESSQVLASHGSPNKNYSEEDETGSSSSSSKADSTDTGNATVASSQADVWILFRSDQTVRDIRNRIAWFRPEDKRDYYLKSDTGVEYRDLDTAIQESSSPTQTREDSRKSSREQRSQWKDELIHSFLELADGVTREVATVYLTLSNWNVEEAFSFLLEESSQVLASHGSPNKNYSEEDETGSSSSSSKADSTDTGNATVASSQVDVCMDSFRSDQTVRDIHNRIAWFRPEDKKDYYLKSDTGVEYRDLDTAVHSITSGSRGSTILHQMYST